MEDPCLRKKTNPLPVVNQVKRRLTGEETMNIKKSKNILEEDLALSGGESETDKSVKDLINIMIEEAVEEEGSKNTPTTTLKKVFKSKEVISSSSSDDEDGPEKVKDERRKAILIPPPEKRQCRYVFVKKPKKGERCTNLTTGQFCMIHSKQKLASGKISTENTTNKDSTNSIRELQLSNQELSCKIDHILSTLNEHKQLKNKIIQMESKLEGIKNHEVTNQNLITKKIHKLNRNISYTVIGYDGKREMKLSTKTKNIILKLPKDLRVPDNVTGKMLKFNNQTNKFEFS